MYRIAICNENNSLNTTLTKHIEQNLSKYNIIFQLKTYYQLLTFYHDHLQENYHLLFIHTDFNNKNGLSCCKFLRTFHFYQNIVIITQSNIYPQDYFSIHPFDYLTTPINNNQLLDCLLYTYQSIYHLETISFHNKRETIKLCIYDILYIESKKTYIYIHTKNKTVPFKYKIQDINTILDSTFIRCHQSFVVNMHYISAIQRYSLVINDQFTIPISKKYSQDARKKYQDYLNTFSLNLSHT